MNQITDTIAAIATAVGNSGIGIIRISGENALEVIHKIFKSNKENKNLLAVKSHTVHYGYIFDGDIIIDEALVLIMKAPNTYTRENTVEINCHGGVLVMKKILETVIRYGARPAEPGEFTKRAFLNGRIDLSQAEAVIDVINAKNEFALSSSLSQLKGSVSNKIKEIREIILYNIAFIESALDDPEHISTLGYGVKLMDIMSKVSGELKSLLDNYDNGRIRTEGVKTVILGKPNAGKSSLLNILLGEERAIVTDIAGTTRDTLEENININGISLNLIDTAGIRKTEDIIEKIGVEKAVNIAKEADLIIYVVDSSVPLDDNDMEIIELIKNKKAIILLNKSDLHTVVAERELSNLSRCEVISISAKENTGVDKLEHAIKEMFYNNEIGFNDELYITNIRHKAAIQDAYESLRMVEESIHNNMPEDFYSIDLMNAYEVLGTVIGEAVEDDLVDKIFNEFCMGK